jgi:formylmethanofuran dehydrogenase subunit E
MDVLSIIMQAILDFIENLPDEVVEDARQLHGHLAPGIILGFKMAQRAFRDIQTGLVDGDVIMLTSETTKCLPDAFLATSRYLFTKEGWGMYCRTYDVGKLAVQVTVNHEDRFRLVLDEACWQERWPELHAWAFINASGSHAQESQLTDRMREIDIDRAFLQRPFRKAVKAEFKGKQLEICPECGESTSRQSMVEVDGRLVCKTCVFFEKEG